MKHPIFQFNKPTKVLGITIKELYALIAAIVFFMMIAVILSNFVKISLLYFPICALIIGSAYVFLRKINRKKYPNYLISFLSYHLFQPWVVEPVHIELESLSKYKELYFKLKSIKSDENKKD